MSSPERTRLRHHKPEISSFRWTKIGFTVTCYATNAEAVERVRCLVEIRASRLSTLADADWHEFLLQAMRLFYLTHRKVFEQGLEIKSAAGLAALV